MNHPADDLFSSPVFSQNQNRQFGPGNLFDGRTELPHRDRFPDQLNLSSRLTGHLFLFFDQSFKLLCLFDGNRGVHRQLMQGSFVGVCKLAIDFIKQFKCTEQFSLAAGHRHAQNCFGAVFQFLVDRPINFSLFAFDVCVDSA